MPALLCDLSPRSSSLQVFPRPAAPRRGRCHCATACGLSGVYFAPAACELLEAFRKGVLMCGSADAQLPEDKSSDAQWLEAAETGGAEGVEELALKAVQQLKQEGWDVARDLQVPPSPIPARLCGALLAGWAWVRACRLGRDMAPTWRAAALNAFNVRQQTSVLLLSCSLVQNRSYLFQRAGHFTNSLSNRCMWACTNVRTDIA